MPQPGAEGSAPPGVDLPKDRLACMPTQLRSAQGNDANVPTINHISNCVPPNSGEQQVVPEPHGSGGEAHHDALTHPPLEPQKSQEACCLTDDDDTTRADGGQDMDLDCQEEEEDAEEGSDHPTPKTIGTSLFDAASYDSIVIDKRRDPAAVAKLLANTASGKKRRAPVADGDYNATATSGGAPIPTPKRKKTSNSGPPDAHHHHRRHQEGNQRSNGGGSGEGSNEPSEPQDAAMGGAAMDNGTDESGEKECKSILDPRTGATGGGTGGGSGSGELAENTNNDGRGQNADSKMLNNKRRHVQEQGGGGGGSRQGGGGVRRTSAVIPNPWLPLSAEQMQQLQGQQQGAPSGQQPTADDLRHCSSTLNSIHTFYNSAQRRFMAQMQELMGAAMAHHASAAIAAAAAAAGGYPSLSVGAVIPPRTDINAISRACATALGIINSVGGGSALNAGSAGTAIGTGGTTAFPSVGAGLAPSQGAQRDINTSRLPQTAQPFPAGVTSSSPMGVLQLPLPMLPMGLTAHPQLQAPGNNNINAPATIMEALLRGPGSSAEARAASLPLPQMVPVSDGAPTAPAPPIIAHATLPFAVDAMTMNTHFPGLPLPMQLQLAAAAAAARNLPQLQHLRQQQQQQVAALASKPAR